MVQNVTVHVNKSDLALLSIAPIPEIGQHGSIAPEILGPKNRDFWGRFHAPADQFFSAMGSIASRRKIRHILR